MAGLARLQRFQHTAARRRLVHPVCKVSCRDSFNTQPPEGGWGRFWFRRYGGGSFQHTAARRRLEGSCWCASMGGYCFNTQPPEGGWVLLLFALRALILFQHTAARRRLAREAFVDALTTGFQHTAARRRLVCHRMLPQFRQDVSTHSRPKAAGCPNTSPALRSFLFQHTAARRRLESVMVYWVSQMSFQHTAARRRLALIL